MTSSAPKYLVRTGVRVGQLRFHRYLLPEAKRKPKLTWAGILKAQVFDDFTSAVAAGSAVEHAFGKFQVVPVGYEGPPIWESRGHVKHDGSMAQYRCPRVFLIDLNTGDRIEV
jgi:hypothetical protein